MADVLAPQSERWAALIALFATHAERAGFGLVLTPLIEHIEVFQRVGASTDIVRKEMYDFTDKGGRHVAVRPEITASLMRAYSQHRPTMSGGVWKAWTVGPNFRYEQPQAARFRQHFQLDAEVVGSDDPDVDVEVIALLDGFHRALGLTQRTLLINSLGDPDCRPAYLDVLRTYLAAHEAELSEASRATLAVNPLRVLDSKRPEDSAVIEGAPVLLDHLSPASRSHFDRVCRGLDLLGIPYELAPRLVRGLDYYTRTAFEFPSHALGAAQNAIGGGGRYDGLVEQLGGPAGTSGIGFGVGIERLLLACDAEGVFPAPETTVEVWVVDTTEHQREALVLVSALRAGGISADRSYDARSMKAQIKAAGRAARFAAIVGPDEAAAGTVTVRALRGDDRTQEQVPRDALVAYLRERSGGERS